MLIICASAGGSPGVTTAALGLALTWPREVLLADCDPHPSQSVLSGYLSGMPGGGRGLGRLAESYRAHPVGPSTGLLDHTLPLDEGSVHPRHFLPGFTHPRSALLFSSYWDRLAEQLDDLQSDGLDVIVDAGRLDAHGLPRPLLERARTIAVVTRSNLPALAALRLALPELVNASELASASPALVVAGGGRPYSASEIAKQLEIALLADLPWDPPTAEVFSSGALPPRRLTSRPLWKALQALALELGGQRTSFGSQASARGQGAS